MAATQAEKQQNDVNSDKVQPDQHLNVKNTLLQNGTDKNGARGGGGLAVPKGKNTGTKNLGIDMSQYRSESGPASGGPAPGGSDSNMSEQELGPPAESALYPGASASEGPPDGAYGFQFTGRDDMHSFGPRHAFGGQKQQPPPGGPFSQHQQRFATGQSISQPTGPTPTLNQLLQSSNTVQRYQNSYGHAEQYGQGWPQKPYVPPASAAAAAPYRAQSAMSTYSGATGPVPAASPGYGESRSSWPGPPVTGQHGPGSPGPPTSSTPASQSSPQPPSHSPGPGLPPSPQHQPSQHQNFPNRPAQPTTPNAHAPDAADLSGGNSNDSSGGPAPGTPNSQGMRPTPSPTGSTGSRSMSPAVGQQNIPMPPRPSSGQSDGSGRMSHSPMATQGNYPPAHLHGYKGHPGMLPPAGQQMPLYPPNQQYQGGYPARPQYSSQQGYGPPVSQPPPNSMPPQQQYQNRSASNHMGNSQFSPYPHNWSGPTVSSGNHIPAPKGNNGPPPQAPSSPSSGPPRPPHYLKQHLQHKMGFGSSSIPPSPSPPQNYHMGPPPTGHHHSGMGPPPTMGPPASSPLLPNSHPHEGGPMPPPSSTPNSHNQINPEMMDNGITTTAAGNMSTHVTATSGGSVTSVVTTGPDGTPVDEGSQQSTLSNASAASGEDPQCTTPKSRKNEIGHYSHPTTPQSTVPSPGAASMNSMHEEYGDLSSPSWPRTPASPVFNSHVPPPDTYRSKKTDSLSKLYEMDDSPERRVWLDKLLAFMEEKRTPITTCPTISKNPLDLFRLYVFVKERGGFMEVTKNKTWKDIAGMLGIGASSSAAYTLRKHYTKNLLAYECHFDRGGIDPQPIISQVEASSKKKGSKAVSVPSPGSSNSQDSFPPPGSGSGSMDGYGGYGYPPGANPDYSGPPQRPSSQANAPSPHGGSGGANHLSSGGPSPAGGVADNVSVSNPFDDGSPSPTSRGGQYAGGPHPPYPSNAGPRPPNYTGQGYGQYSGSGGPPDQYSPYPGSPGYPPARPGYPPYGGDSAGGTPNSSQGYPPRPSYGTAPGTSGAPASQPPGGPYPTQQDYYRPDQNYGNQQNATAAGSYPGGPPSNKTMPPPSSQPRRHPDFAKDQPNYPQYGQQRPPMYGGWPNNNQYRSQYAAGSNQSNSPQWNQGGRPSGQWDRYPNANQTYQPPQQGGQQWSPIPTPGIGQSSPLRPPMVPRQGKSMPFMTSPAGKGSPVQPAVANSYPQNQLPRREITFPPDSVEATLPVLYRRKRLCRGDLGSVDAWRIIMCLRSGLLAESCYALDVLNVLLFDDTSVAYFGLSQWPGLLELLLEHFRKNLADMFDGPYPPESKEEEGEVDLGGVIAPIDQESKSVVLNNTTDYSYLSRKGHPVKLVESKDDIFIRDDHKDWDVHDDADPSGILAEIPTDPWHLEARHILSTFQAEFGRIPFCSKLNEKKKETEEHHVSPSPKASDKRRRTKTLSDVISRIKGETTDTDEGKVCEQSVDLNVDVSANGECGLKVNDPAGTLKRRRTSDYEDEAYARDKASLVLITESQDCVGKRCLCISNILRSLTFIPGNEGEFAKNSTFLGLVGKLLLLHHEHPPRTQKIRDYDREEDADFSDSCSSLQGENEWWWDFLMEIRENILVSTANIAGQIDLSQYPEEIARPLLDGLLHWAICPSAHGQDPFPSAGPTSVLSPQRLALEALCKLCVTNNNVDLVIATPPFSRLEKLCAVLTKHLCRSEDQVLREFSINLLHYLAAADSGMARVVAVQMPCVSLLVAFIEQAEQSALGVANQHGIGALRDNPDSMGTSLDMLRRAAATLVFLARHPENRPLLVQQESRLLALVMSQILDQQVALLLSKVLYQISRS